MKSLSADDRSSKVLLARAIAPMTAVAMLLAAATAANAQFATCITRPVALGSVPNPNPALVHELDLASGQSTVFFDPLNATPPIPATAPGFQGLAADEANRRLFAITTNGLHSDLYAINYDTGLATFIAQCKIDPAVVSTATNTNGVVLTGLGYDSVRQRLIGTRSLQAGSVAAGTFRPEGLYEVNLRTGQTTPVRTFEVSPASDFTIDGIDYDAASDSFFMADDDDTGGRNVYSLAASNLDAALTLVFTYPAGVNDVDGLAVGGGKVLLLSDGVQGNGGFHTIYDLATGTFDRTIATPYPSYAPSSIGLVNPSGGATYAPGLFGPSGPVACSLADIAGGGPGGLTPDGIVDGADFVSFINSFGVGDPTVDSLADVAGGGANGLSPDGIIDGSDFIAFINAFAAGC